MNLRGVLIPVAVVEDRGAHLDQAGGGLSVEKLRVQDFSLQEVSEVKASEEVNQRPIYSRH